MLEIETYDVARHRALDSVFWLENPTLAFPPGTIWHCGGPTMSWFCSWSTNAAWSNNPFLVKREWFLENIAPVAKADWTKRVEPAVNLSPESWDRQCFVIAQGEGVFTHWDSEKPLAEQSPCIDPFGETMTRRRGWNRSVKDSLRIERGSRPRPTALSEGPVFPIPVGLGRFEIPRIIHQTWKSMELPLHFKMWSETWKRNHPSWSYKLWTDEENRQLVKETFPSLLEFYECVCFCPLVSSCFSLGCCMLLLAAHSVIFHSILMLEADSAITLCVSTSSATCSCTDMAGCTATLTSRVCGHSIHCSRTQDVQQQQDAQMAHESLVESVLLRAVMGWLPFSAKKGRLKRALCKGLGTAIRLISAS